MLFFLPRLTGRIVATIAVLGATASLAQVPDWFDPADSNLANAANAHTAELSAADATRGLLAAGVDPAQGVQAVIDTYAQCDAVFDAVAAASTIAPDRAGDLVQAAALNPRCPCGGENVWAASRLSNRVRIAHRSTVLEVLPSCGCVGAAAQAAAAALPERADQILAAALDANRRASGIIDSIGQVGSIRGPLGAAGGGLTRRDDQRCQADTNPGDAFDPAAHWQTGDTALAALPRSRAEVCAETAKDPETANDEDDHQFQLLIDAYQSNPAQHALVLFNGGRRTVDLGSENVQLELYFPGVKGPGRRLPLTGQVPPEGLFLVAADNADAAVKARADLLLPSTLLEPSEAVVLRRGLEDAGCGCAQLTVAGTLNGLGQVSEAWREKQVEAGQLGRRLVADSVGQIGPEDAALSGWRSPLTPVPLDLTRATDACQADTDITDAFDAGDWRRAVASTSSAACRQSSGTVLISAYRAGRDDTNQPIWRVLDLWNNTGAAIDLGEQGYLLEVYGQGEREASRVIPLSGKLAAATRYRLAADSAPTAIRDQADAVSADLAIEQVDALVLKRLAVRDYGQCDVDVYAALRELRAPVPLVPQGVREYPGEPRPDESVTDPNRGGEIASPN